MQKKQPMNLRLLWQTTNPPKVPLIIGSVLAIINTFCSLMIPLLIKSSIENLSGNANSIAYIPIIILFLLEAISMGFSLYLLSKVGQRLVANLRSTLLEKLLKLKVDFYNKNNPGEIISRVTNDTTVTMNVFSTDIAELLTNLLAILGSLIILFFLDIPMSLVLLSVIPITMLIIIPISKKIQKLSYLQQEKMANLTGFLSQVLGEIRLVKSFTTESYEVKQGQKRVNELYENGMAKAKVESVLLPLLSTVLTTMIIAVVGLGAYRVSKGYISSGELIAFILYVFQIIGPIGSLNRFVTNLKSAFGATDRIFDILNEQSEKIVPSKVNVATNIHSLEVNNLSFSYNDKLVLNNVSFSAVPDTVTAIVGPSGVGKSTLFYLLERFYEPNSGEILINGFSDKDISLDKWRSLFSYVSQDNPMFATTIRNNITYGINREVTDEELVHVAELSNCIDFINNLPNKFDTNVGERGVNLSGGQKQRLTIARAMLKNAPILLLDEATASLDSDSEQFIKDSLKVLMKGKITLIITHRLHSIKDADQIIVLDKKGVSGIGSHEELIKTNRMYLTLSSEVEGVAGEQGEEAEGTALLLP